MLYPKAWEFSDGTDGARTHDLSRVRRTLIPAELRFQNLYSDYITFFQNGKRKFEFFQKYFILLSIISSNPVTFLSHPHMNK